MRVKQDYSSFFIHHDVLTDEYYRGKPLEIGLGTQLLMGDVMVEDTYNVKSIQERPQLLSAKPILESEYPWELQSDCGHDCQIILYDEEEDLFKMLYTVYGYYETPRTDSFKDAKNGKFPTLICYAESKDGFNWVKPMCGMKIGRHEKTNVVFTGRENVFEGGRAILNPKWKSEPEKKYIFIYNSFDGISVAFSPDCRKWTEIEGCNPVIPLAFDTHIHMMYDDVRDVFTLYTRPAIFAKPESSPNEPNDLNGVFRRNTCMTESSDLVHWSPLRLVLHSPDGVIDNQLDNMATFSIGATIFARVNRFGYKNSFDAGQYMNNYWAAGASTDSMKFLFKEEIPNAGASHSDFRCGKLRGCPFYTDDNMMHFNVLYPCYNEHSGKKMNATNLVSFGKNRLVGRFADSYGGWLLTREFILRGTRISVNVETSPYLENPEVTAEIITGEGGNVRGGAYHEGYTWQECDKITTDGYEHVLSWNGSSDLSRFIGKPIYIRFHIKNARLYSFTVLE